MYMLLLILLVMLGDPDENIYILQNGKVQVFITMDGTTLPLKTVKTGESVASLLSFVDVLNVSD